MPVPEREVCPVLAAACKAVDDFWEKGVRAGESVKVLEERLEAAEAGAPTRFAEMTGDVNNVLDSIPKEIVIDMKWLTTRFSWADGSITAGELIANSAGRSVPTPPPIIVRVPAQAPRTKSCGVVEIISEVDGGLGCLSAQCCGATELWMEAAAEVKVSVAICTTAEPLPPRAGELITMLEKRSADADVSAKVMDRQLGSALPTGVEIVCVMVRNHGDIESGCFLTLGRGGKIVAIFSVKEADLKGHPILEAAAANPQTEYCVFILICRGARFAKALVDEAIRRKLKNVVAVGPIDLTYVAFGGPGETVGVATEIGDAFVLLARVYGDFLVTAIKELLVDVEVYASDPQNVPRIGDVFPVALREIVQVTKAGRAILERFFRVPLVDADAAIPARGCGSTLFTSVCVALGKLDVHAAAMRRLALNRDDWVSDVNGIGEVADTLRSFGAASSESLNEFTFLLEAVEVGAVVKAIKECASSLRLAPKPRRGHMLWDG